MLKVDDQFPSHSKVIGLSHRAFRLHVTGLCYCAANLTDGHIAKEALPVVGAIAGRSPAILRELEDARLWVPVPGGWVVHGYLDWNSSKEEVQKRRAAAKASAQRRWHPEGNANGIADSSTKSNASPAFPLPLPREALASSPIPAVDVGHDSHESRTNRVLAAIGIAEDDHDTYMKVFRAARGCAEGDIVAAIEAATGPGVRDRLAVVLATLKKRKERAA